MKILVLLIIGLLVSPLAFCDNVFDDLGDIVTGRKDNIPVSLYLAKTFKDVKYLDRIGADLRIKGSTPYGEDFLDRGSLQIGLEF